ncbi:hypothetical protein VTK26DRAFT_314 [Humicola hyalothermophila]
MGTLVPPWYKEKTTSQMGLFVAAGFFGASMAVAAFDFTRAVRQTHRILRRSHRPNAYIIMVWTVLSSCVTTTIAIWLFLIGKIQPSVWYFVGMLFLWAAQIQCLIQILANRVSLIMYNPTRQRWLKIGLAIAIGIVNVSVFIIWVPARLQISDTWIRINEIWDRAEKVIFTVIDGSLNTYFMWLVKRKLVSNGLTQYNSIFRFNIVMVIISVSLDILIIGMMSLPDDAVYVQVHPLTYLTKLNIEMNMADLIGNVVKRSTEARAAIATAEVYQPHLGVDIDREWLGSAKNVIMPSGNSGGSGGGQMHDLNMNVLNEDNGNPSSRSGDQDPGNADLEAGRTRAGSVGSVQREQRKDSGRSGPSELTIDV